MAANKRKKDDLEVFDNKAEAQVARTLKIIALLQKDWHTVAEVREAVAPGRSDRTIYRDMELIQEYLGQPLKKNAKSEYRFLPGTSGYLLSLDLSAREVVAMTLLCQAGLPQMGNVPYLDAVETGLHKLMCLLSEEQRQEVVEQLRGTSVAFSPTAPEPENVEIFNGIMEAKLWQYGVQIEYDGIYDGQAIQTTLLPYHVCFERHAWYVIGRSSHHQMVRTFHIERILSLVPQRDLTFTRPMGWTYTDYKGNAWYMTRGNKDYLVHLRFFQGVARNVASVRWHKTQRIIKNPDGTIDFYATVSGLSDIPWWILSYSDQVEVISPPALRQIVRDRILAMGKRYGILE